MKEILFKAQRMDNGELVFSGSIIQFLDDGVRSYYMPQFNEKCNTLENEDSTKFIGIEGNFYRVIPETVGQYTTIDDSNLKKIFETDKLKFYDKDGEHIGVVYWCDGEYWIDCTETEGDEGIYGLHYVTQTSHCEVLVRR